MPQQDQQARRKEVQDQVYEVLHKRTGAEVGTALAGAASVAPPPLLLSALKPTPVGVDKMRNHFPCLQRAVTTTSDLRQRRKP